MNNTIDHPSADFVALPFTEAIGFFRDKLSLPTETWDEIWQEAHSRGFTVAGAMEDGLLADLREAVDKAISQGTTLADFRKDFDAIVDKYGWAYKGGRAWRTAVIYNTNLSVAYSAGRYAEMTDPDVLKVRGYWQYLPSSSVHKREEHMAWYGMTLPWDHPWWNEHYPPNGWGCKCGVTSVSNREYERIKGTTDQYVYLDPDTKTMKTDTFNIKTEAPPDTYYQYVNKRTGEIMDVPKGIDPGWAYNPGKEKWGEN